MSSSSTYLFNYESINVFYSLAKSVSSWGSPIGLTESLPCCCYLPFEYFHKQIVRNKENVDMEMVCLSIHCVAYLGSSFI